MRVEAIAWKYVSRMPAGRSGVTMGMPGVTNTSHFKASGCELVRVSMAVTSVAVFGGRGQKLSRSCRIVSVGRERRIRQKECRRLTGEGLVKLEERPVSGVWVGEKHGVRKVLSQSIGVRDGDHLVMDAVDDEGGLMNVFEMTEARTDRLFPLAERRHLCGRDLRGRGCIEVHLSLCKPFDERPAGSLTGGGRCKEDLLQHAVSRESRITKMPGQTWFVEVHDVIAATRRGADENHPVHERGSFLRDLLRHHSAERESKHVAVGHAQRIQEVERMPRHSRHCRRHLACRTPDAGAVEQDHFSVEREWIGDCWIPVVERSSKVLKTNQRSSYSAAKTAIRIRFVRPLEEQRRGRRVAVGRID